MTKVKKAKKTVPKKAAKFNPRDHWKAMPEFEQPHAGPIKILIVSFANKEDMHKFSKLINQSITAYTRSVWFPAVPEERYIDKRYSDKKKKK